jgi:site-specific recombinase XerD
MRALRHGGNVVAVAELLGHASLATTSRYAHARPTDSSARYLAV